MLDIIHTRPVTVPRHVNSVRVRWGFAELEVATEDIRTAVVWRAHDDRPSVIVNLSGVIRRFEAELDIGGVHPGPPTPGEMSILPAGSCLSGEYLGRSITYATLTIDQDENKDRLEVRPRLKHRDEFVYRCIERMAQLAGDGSDVSAMTGQSIAEALRLHLSAAYRHTASASLVRGPVLNSLAIRRIESYVHDNLDRELMLNDLAAVAGMSVHNFLRAFRKAFGTTPAQFVIDQRLRRARWLLTNTAHDIVTIALETGFSGHSHLTATMHRRHGITPRNLREAD
jgi:AraC family transcriptional regulator